MNIKNLSQLEASQLYAAITCQESSLMKMLALAAIQSAVDIHEDMALEGGDALNVNATDIRTTAKAYTDETLRDFRDALCEAIQDANVRIRVQQTLSIKLTIG